MQINSELEQNTGYTITEIYYVFRKRIKIIACIFIFILTITFYMTFTTHSIYKSSTTIMVNEDKNSMSLLDMGFNTERNFIQNEINILESRTTSELVIKKLLTSNSKNNLFLFETKEHKNSLLKELLTLNFLSNKQNIKIDSNLSQIDINRYTNRLRKSIKISNERLNDAIKISIESYDPYEAAMLVNTLIEVFRDRDLEWATGEMSHLKEFLYTQIDKKELELNEIENKLKTFQEKEKIFGLDDNSTIILQNLTEFETEYNNTLASISIVEEKGKYITNQLTKDEKELSKKVSNTINDRLLALKNEMSMLEGELISTSTKYGLNHSAVKDLETKLAKVKNNIEEETRELILNGISVADPIMYRQSLMDSSISFKAIKANLLSRANAYKKLVDEYDKKLSLLPEKVLEYTRLERVRAIHAETYSFMRQKLEEARIGEASKLSKVRVIDKAIPNFNPVKPKKGQNIILGIFLGIGLGAGLAMLLELFDNTIKSIEQIERRGLSILALIPAIGSEQKKYNSKKYIKKNKRVEKLQRRLITHEDPKSPVAESYRSLRTSLMYTRKDKKCNMILVSSPGPSEGKTTTIANLAITYANLGKKTLLVDSDLRKPVIHNVFLKDKTPGLTSYLSNNSSMKEIINRSDIENLDIVTSGVIPPNPSEILESEKMNDFLTEVSEEYDVVLFDSPPLIAVTDAYVLLKHINQFILVIRAGFTDRGALERVLTATKQANLEITGVVMNAMTEEYSYGAGYYYNYYQYYYGDKK